MREFEEDRDYLRRNLSREKSMIIILVVETDLDRQLSCGRGKMEKAERYSRMKLGPAQIQVLHHALEKAERIVAGGYKAGG